MWVYMWAYMWCSQIQTVISMFVRGTVKVYVGITCGAWLVGYSNTNCHFYDPCSSSWVLENSCTVYPRVVSGASFHLDHLDYHGPLRGLMGYNVDVNGGKWV